MNTLTASRLTTARACQRKHWIEYVAGYRPATKSSALRFGTLIHRGLEVWWRDGFNLDAALAAVQAEANPYDRARAEAMLMGYHCRWESERYEVLGVEVEFRAPLTNPETGRASRSWRIAGKLDALVRDPRDGLVKVIEHKTASSDISPGSDYWARLRMDGQVSMYFDGATALGHEPAAVVYDVLAKPGLRPLQVSAKRATEESPEEYRERLVAWIAERPAAAFARGEVVRLEAELAEFRFDIWNTAQQIHRAVRSELAPRNPDSCWAYGSLCPYLAVCSGEATLDDPRFVRMESVHPELTSEGGTENDHGTSRAA